MIKIHNIFESLMFGIIILLALAGLAGVTVSAIAQQEDRPMCSIHIDDPLPWLADAREECE